MGKFKEAKAKALAAYEKASASERALLESIFGAEYFVVKSIFERVTTWEDAAAIYGVDPTKLPFPTPYNDLERAVNSFWQASIITDVINEGWVPNYEDKNERKYEIVFEYKPGFGFSLSCTLDLYSHTCVGARLVFQTPEKAKYVAERFIHIYQPLLTKTRNEN